MSNNKKSIGQSKSLIAKTDSIKQFQVRVVIIITAIAAIAVLVFVIVYLVTKYKKNHESVYDLVRLTS